MNGWTVLVVDDDDAVRTLICRVLENSGFKVLAAEDGSQAQTLLQSYPENVDVLISDIDMPVLDGVELAKRLTADRPNLKVLLMSGRSPAVLPEGVEFLPKPFTIVALLAAMEKLTGR